MKSRGTGGIAVRQREIRGANDVVRDHDDQPLDFVSEFPDVSRPGIVNQQVHRVGSELLGPAAVFSRKHAQEIVSQYGYIFAAVAQRRYEEGNHVQSIKQIFAKTAGSKVSLQI